MTVPSLSLNRCRPFYPSYRSGLIISTLFFAIHFNALGAGVNKCTVGGKIVYQDAPCVQETVAESYRRKENNEVLHRQLDRLQAQGVGMINRSPSPNKSPAIEPSETEKNNYYVPTPKSRALRDAKRDQETARIQEKTQQMNTESASRLTNILDEAKQACGGQLHDYPQVGMSDETFRNCTIHARFGGIKQIVVSKHESIPLRLYVFDADRAKRVYSINGVITAIKP